MSMEGYTWTKADTPQGRERLKELLDAGMKVAIRYFQKLPYPHHEKPNHVHKFAFLIGYVGYSSLPSKGYGGKWEDVIFDGLEFLDPSPRLEPRLLKWIPLHSGVDTATCGDWIFMACDGGNWFVHKGKNILGWNEDWDSTDLSDQMETAKAAIHEWRVSHLKSML